MIPKVTIIIPCYNSEKFVEECVESALNQSYENIEVIAVDNESTDATMDILKRLQEKYDKLIISTAENIYPNCWDEAREEGYKLMTGDYMTVIGSDDMIETGYIEKCVDIMIKSKGIIKAFQSPAMGFKAHPLGKVKTGLIEYKYSGNKNFMQQSLERCVVNSPSVFYDTSLYKKGLLKTFPEKYGGAADYDLYCRLADNGIHIYPIPSWIGFCYRWHEDQATWKVHKEETNYDKMIQDYWREKWKDLI